MAKLVYMPCAEDLDLFDQNGYDLTGVEQHYMTNNVSHHRNRWHHCLKQNWIVQTPKINGAVLNHSLLFERKGYQGPALDQLKHWAKSLPLLYKVISIRPKWGLDFSMDYVDTAGNAFEVLHWEWDGFEYNQVQDRKLRYQDQLMTIGAWLANAVGKLSFGLLKFILAILMAGILLLYSEGCKRFADSFFDVPTSFVPCSNWRCRLL